ncbi:PAS domain S-box protein [Natrialbaceae archaeon A-gly3]
MATELEGEVVVDRNYSSIDDGDSLEGVDCVLSDDPDVVEAVPDGVPIVVVTEGDGSVDIEELLSAGVDDVISRSALEPALLSHRISRSVELSTVRDRLERRESWYQRLIERSSAILMILDEDRRRTYVSPSVHRLTGYDPDELLGERIDAVLDEESREDVLAAFERVLEDGHGSTATCRYGLEYADGTHHVHEATLTNRLEDPVLGGVVVSTRDITEYHQVEREFNESFERVTDAFFALDTDSRFTYVNERAEAILGFDEVELLGREFLEVFPEIEGSKLERATIDAIQTQRPQTVEDYYEPKGLYVEARIYPSESGTSVYFRDVSGRVKSEQEAAERREQLETVVGNVPMILFALDSEGRFTLLEGRGLDVLGLTSGEVVGESLFDVNAEQPGICADARRALDGEPVHSCRRIDGQSFETWYRPIVRDGELERVIGIATDVTDREQYEQALSGLQKATGNLLSVESKQAVFEQVIDVAGDALDLTNVAVYRFDDRENILAPATYSTGFVTVIGSPPRLEPGNSITWDVFASGRARVLEDVRESPLVYDEGTDARSGLYVPLGEHGVLFAASMEPGAYDEDDLDLASLLAGTAEAALDRIGRTRRLHERERELEAQNDRLERLNHALTVREDIEALLLRAESRPEIEREVCQRLVETDACVFAWIGEPDPGGNRVVPRSSAGRGGKYLEAITATTVRDDAAEPTGHTAHTREPTYIKNVADSVQDGEWRTDALSRNFQSVVSIPLVYDDFLYGVLSVYADSRDGFDETLRSTLEELGETIAYSIDAVGRREAIMSDEVTEIELAVDGETPFAALTERVDATVELEGVVPREGGETIVFVTLETDLEAGAVADVDGFEDVTVVRRDEGKTLVRVRYTEPFLGSAVENYGGTLRRFVADEDGVTATIDVPRSIDVREVYNGVTRRGFAVSLLARRERTTESDDRSPRSDRDRMLASLTDRQREVAQTAYHGGFFEWPRETTGEDLATSLDISPPAFHNHVRIVQRKVFSALFDD